MAHSSRLCYVTIDCNDLDTGVAFWTAVTGGNEESFAGDRTLKSRRLDIPNSDLRIVLQLVPEPKTCKSRTHLCFESDDVEAEASRLQQIGAKVASRQGEFGPPFYVLLDPFDNEFCIVQAAYPDLLKSAGVSRP